jgi:hypothetical protein
MEDFVEKPIPTALVEHVKAEMGEPVITAPTEIAPAVLGTITPESPLVVPSPLPIIDDSPDEVAIVPVAEVPLATEPVVDAVVPGTVSQVIDLATDEANTMEMMDRCVHEESALSAGVNQVMEIQQGLEDYLELLKMAGPDGVSRQTAGFMRVGLEMFHATGKLDLSKEIASMEDMGEGERQHLLPSNVKKKTLTAKLGEIAKMFWEWLKRVYAKGDQFVSNMVNGVTILDQRLKKVSSAIDKAKETPGEFTVPSPEKIAVGSNVNITIPTDLVSLTALATNSYPKRLADSYKAIADALESFDIVSDTTDRIKDKVTAAGDQLEDVKATEVVFPGNQRVDVSDDGLSFGMKQDDSPEIGEVKADRRSPGTMKKEVARLEHITGELKKYKSSYDEMRTAAERIGKALDRIEKDARKPGMEDSAVNSAEELARHVNTVVHKTNPRGNEIIKYLVRTASAYVSVLAAEVGEKSEPTKEVAV